MERGEVGRGKQDVKLVAQRLTNHGEARPSEEARDGPDQGGLVALEHTEHPAEKRKGYG